MGKITALRVGQGRRKRINVSLDNRHAFSLEAETALKEGLKVGQELSASQIETLMRSDHQQRCLQAAARYFSYRPRSEAELRGQLRQRGFDETSIDGVLARLKETGAVNDMAFAQFWKENRESFGPRSQWLTRLELKQKGVASDIIDQVTSEIDDEDSAYRAALSRARGWVLSDYLDFRRRLRGYLKRRGFTYGVINHTTERLWQELGGK